MVPLDSYVFGVFGYQQVSLLSVPETKKTDKSNFNSLAFHQRATSMSLDGVSSVNWTMEHASFVS